MSRFQTRNGEKKNGNTYKALRQAFFSEFENERERER
jgi:hypothetical protein